MKIRQCFSKLQLKMSGMFFETHCSMRLGWHCEQVCRNLNDDGLSSLSVGCSVGVDLLVICLISIKVDITL